MPGLSGYEVLSALKRHQETRDIPVIIATSKVIEETERRQLAGSTVGIVPKSAPRANLLGHLRQALLVAGLGPVTQSSNLIG
jgi:CheY-like chemotaxis protein